MDIFSYVDIDGDILRIGPAPEDWDDAHDGCLAFTVTQRGQDHSVALPPSVVDDLTGVLERWRSGVITAVFAAVTPPADLNPIYDAIVKRLTDEWLPRVLPLHQAPQAFTPEPDAEDGWQRIDPEPHDVGHADEPAKPHPTDWSDKLFGKPTYDAEPEHGRLMSELPRRVHSDDECGECGHSWRMHPPAFGVSYCAQYTDAVVCGCHAARGTA